MRLNLPSEGDDVLLMLRAFRPRLRRIAGPYARAHTERRHEAGHLSQHLLASPARAETVLGWRDTGSRQVLRRLVTWHLAHPPSEPDDDFSDDDASLARAM